MDFEKLHREESGRILATLIGLLGDFDLAEEMLQEAYAVALQKQARFEDAAEAFTRYLEIAPENTNRAEIKQRIIKLRQWARGW